MVSEMKKNGRERWFVKGEQNLSKAWAVAVIVSQRAFGPESSAPVVHRGACNGTLVSLAPVAPHSTSHPLKCLDRCGFIR